MTPPARILDIARRSRKTLYVVTSLYVAIGFWLAVPAALAGDRLSTFLGFLIISGALVAAVGVGAMLRLAVQVADLCGQIRGISERIGPHLAASGDGPPVPEATTVMMDLTVMGTGGPSRLVAAQLDRDAFPRLAATMADVSATGAAEHRALSLEAAGEPPGHPIEGPAFDSARQTGGVTTWSPMERWRAGLRDGDLAACREAFSTLAELAERDVVRRLQDELRRLTDETASKLRARFTAHASQRDFKSMVRVGEEICALIPDHAYARQYRALAPHLTRRLPGYNECDASPPRMVHCGQGTGE